MIFATPVMAQTATEKATSHRPVTRPLGAYDLLPDGEKRIVSAIYEAQLGSANDTASGGLLSRDDITGLREKDGWGNAYKKLYAKGMVMEKNLGQAISTYVHSIQANRHITVINTGGGEQLAFSKDKPDNAPSPAAKPAASNGATAKPVVAKPAAVTTVTGSGNGQAGGAAVQ